MLDALKHLADGSKREVVLSERHELERLIETARAERAAMDDRLVSMRARSASLTPIATSLEHIAGTVTGMTTKLAEIGERLTALDGRTRELEQLDGHIQGLRDAAQQADQRFQIAISPNSELEKHRQAVEQLSLQAQHAHASLDTLRMEHAAVEELRDQLRTAQTEIRQSIDHAGALESTLEQLRGMASRLTEDCARVGETSRMAREDTAAAMTAITEVEQKLGSLAQFQELGQDTEARLVALNALAERVALKAKVIEGQQLTVEHALVQANRVNEMVWSMDLQIGKVNDGMKQAATVDETLARLEKLSADATERLESAAKLREETERQTTTLEKRGALLLESMHAQVGALAVDKTEVEALDARLRALDGEVGHAQVRMGALAGQDELLSSMAQGVAGLSKRFDDLFAQCDELTRRQLTLEGLHERLEQVDDLATKASSQMDWLQQGRENLEGLRKDVLEFHQSHAEIAQLSAALAADRQALEAFGERMTVVIRRAPELEARVDAILGKVSLVEKASQKATWLTESMSALDAQVSRVEARAPLVERIEARLNSLNTLSTEIDRRLEEQLERRTDIDRLKTTAGGVVVQLVDAQHKLDALNELQTRFLPLVEQVHALNIDVDSTRNRLEAMKPDGVAIAAQERRFAELTETSRILESELAARTRHMQALTEELSRSANLKDTLLSELDGVQSRQRDIVGQMEAYNDQLARAEKMFKHLEERRAQISIGERKLVAVEARLAEINQVSDEIDRSFQTIVSREQLVSAVKAEVEAVHLISARSKADLDYVMQHRGEVAAAKMQVDRLSSLIADTDQRVVSIEARRKHIEEVENKATVIVDLLDDVRINLETIGEQKAVVDQAAETVAQLEFRLQEARSTLGTLQHEREMAERLEHGIRQLCLKPVRSEDMKTLA